MVEYRKGDLVQYKIDHYLKYLKINTPEEFKRFFFDINGESISGAYAVELSSTIKTPITLPDSHHLYGDVWVDAYRQLHESLALPSFCAWYSLSADDLKKIKKPIITILSERFCYPKGKSFEGISIGFYHCLVTIPYSTEHFKLFLAEKWIEANTQQEYWQQHYQDLAEIKTKQFAKTYLDKLAASRSNR